MAQIRWIFRYWQDFSMLHFLKQQKTCNWSDWGPNNRKDQHFKKLSLFSTCTAEWCCFPKTYFLERGKEIHPLSNPWFLSKTSCRTNQISGAYVLETKPVTQYIWCSDALSNLETSGDITATLHVVRTLRPFFQTTILDTRSFGPGPCPQNVLFVFLASWLAQFKIQMILLKDHRWWAMTWSKWFAKPHYARC